jgi:hypothetical protein
MKSSFGFILSLLLLLNSIVPPDRSSQARVFHPEALHADAGACLADAETFTPAPITWNPVEVECPVCKTKNVFLQWISYGNYIYQYPSKYQLIFWPHTDSPAWYSCKKCRLTTFMGDFADIPQDKIPALREALKGVTLPPQKERSMEASMEKPPYLELPTSARLVAAEKVYRALGHTKDEFWDNFYRVMGYHFDQEKKVAEADEARRKSLAIIERTLADKTKEGVRKELLYVSGAMRHFLRDDAGALRDFEAAKKLTYSDKDSNPENNKGADAYLSKLIDEYIEMLRKGEGPRTMKAAGAH